MTAGFFLWLFFFFAFTSKTSVVSLKFCCNSLFMSILQYEFWNVPRSEVYLNMQKFLGTGAWGFVVEGTFRGQQVAVKCLHDMIHHCCSNGHQK